MVRAGPDPIFGAYSFFRRTKQPRALELLLHAAGEANMEDKKAILYARYSPRPDPRKRRHATNGQTDSGPGCESIETQLERLRAWCQALGWEIAGEYCDREKSGASTDRRPGLHEAISHVCKIRGVLCVYSLSRLARNTRDALAITDRLSQRKADLASIHERLDTGSPMGQFFFTIMAAMAELERKQISERTSDAMLRHQASGRRMGRTDRAPFGSAPSPDNPDLLIQVPGEQAAIARILDLHAAGEANRNICRILDAEGIPRRGKTWAEAHGTVASVIRRAGV